MAGYAAVAQNPFAGVGANTDQRTVVSTSISILNNEMQNIGYISQLGDSANRNVTRIRHLNHEDAGRVVETVLSPEDRTLSVSGFALYNVDFDGSVVQRIGGSSTRKKMASLEEQSIPFMIVQKEVHPVSKEETITTYHDCMLTSHSKTSNIGTATISESANILVGWVENNE